MYMHIFTYSVWETMAEIDEILVQSNSILLASIDKNAQDLRLQIWQRIALRYYEYVCLCVCVCERERLKGRVCVCQIHTCTHTHKHTHTHTHTHTTHTKTHTHTNTQSQQTLSLLHTRIHIHTNTHTQPTPPNLVLHRPLLRLTCQKRPICLKRVEKRPKKETHVHENAIYRLSFNSQIRQIHQKRPMNVTVDL